MKERYGFQASMAESKLPEVIWNLGAEIVPASRAYTLAPLINEQERIFELEAVRDLSF